MKKFLSIILAILMVVTMLPMAAYAATSGSCGDGVYFTIENGTLTITGSGEVMEQAASTCWSKERPNIKKIVIGSGITLPNSFAFYGHGNLTTVEYGNTVATIGFGTFNTCINITSFTLREGVGMSSNAFAEARKLTGANVKLVDASGNDKSSFYTVTVESNTSSRNYMTVKGNLAKGYIADIPAQDHTGEEVKPAVKVIWNGQTVSSSNYDVTYSNNIELGTATVTVKGKDANYYTGTLTQTFEIKPHVHDWSNKDGICAGGCGLECAHESFTDGVCTTCGYVCVHNNIVDSKCLVCGLTGKFIAINMYDYYGDGWLGNEIIISKLLADGSSEAIDTATLEDGEEGTYRLIVGTDDVFTLTWKANNYSGDCTFTVDVDGKNVFESKICNNYEDGEVVYTYCKHTFENGVCTACDHVCLHKNVADDSCLDCSLSLKNVTINMHDGYGDGWDGAHIIISKLLADGSFREIGLATLENIGNGIYDFPIAESDIYSLKWQSGSKDYFYTFEVLVDGETVFESKNCDNYKDGEIVYINCEHTFENGTCTVCGISCTHTNISGNKCLICGLTGKIVTINMFDSYGDGWNDSNVIISKLFDDGSSAEIGTATLKVGEEGTYNLIIDENDVFALKWEKGIYDSECTFEVLIDGEIVFESESCDNYEAGEIVYINCEHTFENGVCTACGHACRHKNVADDSCLDCYSSLKNVTINMHDGYGDGWDGANVIISKLLDNGSSAEIGTATLSFGEVEGTYSLLIAENSGFTLKWEKGTYDSECTFEVLIDGEIVFESESCDNYEDGEVVYTYCKHTFENGVCTVCGYKCDHNWSNNDGVCANGCGLECPHENETGETCSVCGATIRFATITGVSINIDGVVYTSDNTSAENPAVINPDSVVTVTAIGENFDLLPDLENTVIGFTYFSQSMQWLYNNPSKFDIDTVNNTVSFLANYDVLPQATTASELTYTNDGWYTDIGSGVYVIYIDKKDIADTLITLDNTEFIYSGNSIEPTVLVMADGQTLMEGEHYTLTFENNVNAGTASVTVKGIGDYAGEITKDFTITKAYYNLTAPTPNTPIYNGEDQYLVSAGTVEGADFEYSLDGVSWSTSIPQAKDAGNYTVYYRVLADENHYDIEGTVDVTIKECTHEWGEGVLTRPVYDAVLGSKDGYYTYTCTACGEEKTEAVKSADYSAYEAVSEEINALLQSDELTDAAKQAIYSAANECGLLSNDLTESEQNKVDDLVAELEKIIADAEEKIASGEYVKIDGMKEYNKIAGALDAELMENYSQEEFAALAEKAGDEINARFGEIIEKAESLTGTVAENKDAIAEIESEMRALYGEIKNCLDGVHNGFVYEVTEEAKCEVNAIESATCTLCGETDEREVEGTALTHSFTKYEVTEEAECGKAGKEVAYCDNGCGATDEKEIPALEHIFLDYVSNGDATCTADGTKTAECVNGCGATDTVADEGTMLDHVDEDGDKLCDDCETEIIGLCSVCGRPVHEGQINEYICLIIALVKLVVKLVKTLQGVA